MSVPSPVCMCFILLVVTGGPGLEQDQLPHYCHHHRRYVRGPEQVSSEAQI